MNRQHDTTASAESGSTLIEVIIATVVLVFGVLGFAGTTAQYVRQVTISDLRAERVAATRAALEQIRALPYDNVSTGSDTVGHFRVSWSSQDLGNQAKAVKLITVGPGVMMSSGGGEGSSSVITIVEVPDTFEYKVLRP